MEFREAALIALQSLWANKLRSVLTLLGMVIAISALIAVGTLITGLNSYVAEKVFNLGADVFIVNKQPNVITSVDQYLEAQKRKNLTYEDYEAVRDGCHSCTVVGASTSLGLAIRNTVRYGNQSIQDTAVRGWTPSMSRIYDLEVIMGRHMNENDFQRSATNVVIGYDIYENLFVDQDPIGKEIRVGNHSFQVIGVGRKEGKTLGQSRDNWVMMPLKTYFKVYGGDQINGIRIWAKAADTGQTMVNAMDETRVILRARRHVRPGEKDNFEIDTNQTFLSLWANISSGFFVFTLGIVCMSLLVGGIVIMNMMLVSVTERTREIGVRKALGARQNDIMAQFLIESATMAAVGGAIGVAVGALVAKTVTLLVGLPSRLELWAVLLALGLAAGVGVFFGVYPARKAARLEPIVALRAEL
jgi:putative ABC transport system permease protein